MSTRRKALPLIWTQAIGESDLDSTARHVARALSDFMDRNGACFPGREKIAKSTGYSVRTVERAIPKLEWKGWLEVERGTGRRSNIYRATLPPEASDSRHKEWELASASGDSVSRSGDSVSRSGATGVARKQLKAKKVGNDDACNGASSLPLDEVARRARELAARYSSEATG
jgi:hypothetical protein